MTSPASAGYKRPVTVAATNPFASLLDSDTSDDDEAPAAPNAEPPGKLDSRKRKPAASPVVVSPTKRMRVTLLLCVFA